MKLKQNKSLLEAYRKVYLQLKKVKLELDEDTSEVDKLYEDTAKCLGDKSFEL